MKKNLIVKRGTVRNCDLVKFNKYLIIPNKEIKSFNHDFTQNFLKIKLYNNQIIIIQNFDNYDFKNIEYYCFAGTDNKLYGKKVNFEYVDFEECF